MMLLRLLVSALELTLSFTVVFVELSKGLGVVCSKYAGKFGPSFGRNAQ
jgi:hypothetical protein